MTTCAIPFGIANAYITSQAPYNPGDYVTYSCLSGFSMTGVPTQVCSISGQWTGTPPVCTAIMYQQDINNSQQVTSDVPIWLLAVLGGFLGLILLMFLAAVCMFLCWFRPSRRPQIRPTRPRKMMLMPDRDGDAQYARPQQVVMVDIEDEEYYSTKDNSVTHQQTNGDSSTTSPSYGRFYNAAAKVMEDNEQKRTKIWMPHSNPVRNINTSTK